MELIIMAILAGIVSLINNQKKKGEQKEPTPRPTSPSSIEQSPKQERVKNAKQAFDRRAKDLATEYEKQKAEIEKAKPQRTQRRGSQEEKPVVELSRTIENPRSERSKTKRSESKASEPIQVVKELSIKGGLQEKDLVNGIVLTEILGPPRSKKSHARHMTR